MRILDTINDSALKNVILYMKINEAKELYDSIGQLLDKIDFNNHAHINDELYEHEITVVLYDEKHTDSLSERSKEIIFEDI